MSDNCRRALATIPAGSKLQITTSALDVTGQFDGVRENIVVLVENDKTVEITASDVRRIVRVGNSRAAYAKRGLLIGAAAAVLTAIRSHASAGWAAFAVFDFASIGAGIGAAAGSSAHEGVLLCGGSMDDIEKPKD